MSDRLWFLSSSILCAVFAGMFAETQQGVDAAIAVAFGFMALAHLRDCP